MSVDLAAVLRDEGARPPRRGPRPAAAREAKTAQAIAERLGDAQDKAVLEQLAAKLIEIAERLERDARD